jgi:hypothetical protein
MDHSPSRVRRFLGVLAMASSVVVPIACSGDSSITDPNTNFKTVIGNYSLSSISGKAAPVTMYSDENYLVVISAGTLTMSTDGSFVAVTTTKETVLNHLSTYVDTMRGTWINGTGSGTVVLTGPDASKSNGSWGGGKLTLIQGTGTDTMTVVYSK